MPVLDGSVALVTGAGRGIGRAVSIALAREGASVLVNDTGVERDGSGGSPLPAAEVADAIRAAGGTAVPDTHDVSTLEGTEGAFATCTNALGSPDIVVTCAGIVRDASLQSMTPRDLDALLGVHLKGTILTVQQAATRMKRRGGGRIIVTTGHAGLLGNVGQAGYAAAAAGIYGFARTAAAELQRHAITVNIVSPIARTRCTSDLPMFEHVDSMQPEHVAPAYVFFASPLSGDRTGHVLSVAGGRIARVELVELSVQFKEATGGAWTPREIEEHWPALSRRPNGL
jgi:NAD(P)-dependent dehydrogenase (short-subunit alcohol dehydrogenase family)